MLHSLSPAPSWLDPTHSARSSVNGVTSCTWGNVSVHLPCYWLQQRIDFKVQKGLLWMLRKQSHAAQQVSASSKQLLECLAEGTKGTKLQLQLWNLELKGRQKPCSQNSIKKEENFPFNFKLRAWDVGKETGNGYSVVFVITSSEKMYFLPLQAQYKPSLGIPSLVTRHGHELKPGVFLRWTFCCFSGGVWRAWGTLSVAHILKHYAA